MFNNIPIPKSVKRWRSVLFALIIITVVILAAIGFRNYQIKKLRRSAREVVPAQNEIQNQEISLTQSNLSFNDSPFGFLYQYVNWNIPLIQDGYKAYGGFAGIQSLYKDLGIQWERGSCWQSGEFCAAYKENIGGNPIADFNEYIRLTNENNINLLITIFSDLKNLSDVADTTELNNYIESVKKMVGHYPTIKYWQIRNEINFNKNNYDPPQREAKFVQMMSNAIKETCSDCKVVLGSSANVDVKGDLVKIETYFDPLLQELSKIDVNRNYIDVFDYHFFAPNSYNPESYYRLLDGGIDTVKNLLGKYGYNKVSIWTTETMLFTTDGMNLIQKFTLPANYRNVNEKQQAKALFKTYILGLSKGIKRMFWNKLTEGDWGKIFRFNYCGLVRNPDISGSSNKKLGFYTYKLMSEKLDGSDWENVRTIQESDDIYIYEFTRNGKRIFVAWNDSSSVKRVTKSGFTSARIKVTEVIPKENKGGGLKDRDYPNFFKTEKKLVIRGEVTVSLGSNPVFIEEE
ncbi:hypothetical protein A2Y99_05230 [Candidatus Gottesmanbacteria bacterium RBG_13_37_7]|uniref:Glycoside hydrolase family 5 domain-containing protein n=1 Tax=Candidatus Gottesmanbacteria bacterium RBG_13_37_7 TaxID=1798369 RepID=A0A1F5YKL5_9BACT|nr:MAG: hypothetical protein A2Y99_05230 [Candidatus Gottesmanbacteria bacterium RBG_13_37_7]